MCHPGQSKEKFTAYANEKSKKVLQRYNLKCWVIIGVREYFAPLNKIYGIPASFFHCHAQLSRSDHFWIFNGDRLLMTLERYGFKKWYVDEFCQNFYGKTPADWLRIGSYFTEVSQFSLVWIVHYKLVTREGERFWFTTVLQNTSTSSRLQHGKKCIRYRKMHDNFAPKE